MTINAPRLNIDPDQAHALWQEYRKNRKFGTQEDFQIRRAYHLIAQGKTIIRAIHAVANAGLNAEGLPKLALCPAYFKACRCTLSHDGSGSMDGASKRWTRRSTSLIEFARGTFVGVNGWATGEAMLPPIPLDVRPKRGIDNYSILWEAEWRKVVPQDPYLLRRIGRTDLWLVCAAWDLTAVEREVLQSRLNG